MPSPPLPVALLGRTDSRDCPIPYSSRRPPRPPRLETASPLQPRSRGSPDHLRRNSQPSPPGSASRVVRALDFPRSPERCSRPAGGVQGAGSAGGWDRSGGGGAGRRRSVCERVWLGEAIACLIVAVAALPLLSQRERDTSGQAQPQPQQQPPRRHGAARHKERYGDPPRRQPPPGRAAGPRGHSSPPGTGPEGRRGAGPARGGWAGNPGPHGVRGQPASGAGGCRGSNCQRCPGSPPLAAEGAGSGGGEAGEPRFPPGRGPAGINPFWADGLIVIPPPRRPSPPPTGGADRACARDPRPGRAAPSRTAEGRAARRGVGARRGPRASPPRPPPPPRWPLPSPTRAPAPRLRPPPPFGFLSALLSSRPRQTPLPAPRSPATPGKPPKKQPEAGRPAAGTFPARSGRAPRARARLAAPLPAPRGAPGGEGGAARYASDRFPTASPS